MAFLSCFSTYLSTYLPTYLSTYLSICLSIYLSIYLSPVPSIYLLSIPLHFVADFLTGRTWCVMLRTFWMMSCLCVAAGRFPNPDWCNRVFFLNGMYNRKVNGLETTSSRGQVLYHLESKWLAIPLVLVYHGPLQIATFRKWRSPSTFTTVYVDSSNLPTGKTAMPQLLQELLIAMVSAGQAPSCHLRDLEDFANGKPLLKQYPISN